MSAPPPRPRPTASARTLRVAVGLAIAVAVGLLGGALHWFAAGPGRRGPANCAPNAILVNPCRPWLGAAVHGNPGAPGQPVAQGPVSQFRYLEQLTGHSLDIYRSYHSPLSLHGTNAPPLTKDEIYLAERPHTYVDVNWKPAATWQAAAGGNAAVNAEIRRVADSIKAISPHTIFLTLWWEPQGSVSAGTSNCCYLQGGCPGTDGGAGPEGAGSPAQYVAMWRNVEAIFRQQGVRNVVWAMDYMSYPNQSFRCLVPSLWPGNKYVDWVLYDTYDHHDRSGTNWNNTVGRFYRLLQQDSSPRTNFTSKPWGLGEFGTCHNHDPANTRKYYLQAKAAFEANTYPRLKMYIVYANTGNNSGPACLTDYDEGPFGQYIYDPAKQAAFNQFARAVFSRG